MISNTPLAAVAKSNFVEQNAPLISQAEPQPATPKPAVDSLGLPTLRPETPGLPKMSYEQAAILTRRMNQAADMYTNTAMLSGGEFWQRSRIVASIRDAKAARGDLSPVTIDEVSAHNMRALHKKFSTVAADGTVTTKPLDALERGYLERGLQKKFYATHFTNANLVDDTDGAMKLTSRRRLEKAKVAFADHLMENEVRDLRNDNHTFFALETSDVPQKTESRFGKNVYRVPLEHAEFAQAFGGHRDPGIPQFPASAKHFNELSRADHKKLGDRWQTLKWDTAEDLYTRKHLVPSILLRNIVDARSLSPNGHKLLMSAKTDAEYNRNINGLLRPQLLSPRVTHVPQGEFKFYGDVKSRENIQKSSPAALSV